MARQRAADHQPPAAPTIVHEVLRSPGQPLDPAIRADLEPRFGHDFSRVRVHADARAAASAQAVNALAYTVGSDLVFGAGQFAPRSAAGRRLLAHELTHVVQQRDAAAGRVDRLAVQTDEDPHEREADRIAAQVTQGPVLRRAPAVIGTLPRPRVQRYSFGSGAGPDFGGGDRLVEVPAAQRPRVEDALNIASRVVNNPRDYPECPRFFETNCPSGSATALYDAFNRAVVWFNEGAPATRGGVTAGLGGENIGYTDLTFRIGRWAMAASFIHELMHVCSQGDHDIGDRAKNACGRLPDIIRISPRIEITNPIR